MVAANETPFHLTPDDYFAWEAQQREKYEYIDGRVYAMSGGIVNHGCIAIRLTAMFDAHVDGRTCIPGNSDIKIHIAGTQDYTYPDASVTCDDRDKSTPNYFTYPCLIVEVLSKSTEACDRGRKFRLYRQNPILQDYLLVSSTHVEIDLYRQTPAGQWMVLNYRPGDTIELQSINLSFPIEEIYRGLTLNPEA